MGVVTTRTVATFVGLALLAGLIGVVWDIVGLTDVRVFGRNESAQTAPVATGPPAATRAAPTKSSPARSTGPRTTSQSVKPTKAASPIKPAAATMQVSELPTVDGNEAYDLDWVPASIDGRTYANSLVYTCDLYCDGSSPETYTVSLGRRYVTFSAVAGILDTAADGTRQRFEITVDNRAPQSFTPAIGKPLAVKVDVRGALRLRIRIFAPGELLTPLEAGAAMAGGDSPSGMPAAALGNPQVQTG